MISGASGRDHLGEPLIVVIGDRTPGSIPGERRLELGAFDPDSDEVTRRVIGGTVAVHAVDPINGVRLAIDMGCESADIGKTKLSRPVRLELISVSDRVEGRWASGLPSGEE